MQRRVVYSSLMAALLTCSSFDGQVLKTPDSGAPQKLMIIILEGENALNNIRERDAREPIVEVTDENHKPVAGALVIFTTNSGSGGAGATFTGAQTLTVRTGSDGIAHAPGLQLGPRPGSFTISVSATVAGVGGLAIVASEMVIHQSNVIGALAPSTSAASGSASSTASRTEIGDPGRLPKTHSGTRHVLHFGRTAKVVVAAAAVATVVAVSVVLATQHDSTSLGLGSTTVGHP
jgi:hypothetical protein